MKTKFLTIIISAFSCVAICAQTSYSKVDIKNDSYTQQAYASPGHTLSFKSGLNAEVVIKTEKNTKDVSHQKGRTGGGSDHVGAYDFGNRMTWFAKLQLFFSKRKPGAKG